MICPKLLDESLIKLNTITFPANPQDGLQDELRERIRAPVLCASEAVLFTAGLAMFRRRYAP
jgi:hypothetical protein